MSETGLLVSRRMLKQSTLPGWFYVVALALVAGITAVAVTVIDQPIYVIGAVIALPAMVAIFVKPQLGMLLLVFVTFTRAFEILFGESDGGLSLYTLYLGFLMGVLLLRWILYGEKIEGWQPAAIMYGILGMMILASLLYADKKDEVIFQGIIFVKDMAMLFLLIVMIKRADDLRLVVWMLLAAAIFLGSITVFQQATNSFDNTFLGFGEVKFANILHETEGNRIGGPGLDPNLYGQMMLVLVPLAWERIWNEKKLLLRALAGWAFVVCILAIIFSFSRGNFIGMVFVLGLLFVIRPPSLTTFLVASMMALMLLPFIPKEYTQRLTTLSYIIPSTGGGDEDSMGGISGGARQEISFRGRLSENIVGILMTLDHPVIGVGYGNFQNNYQRYSRTLGLDPRREGRSAHNLFLEFSAELGFLGLLWLVALQWVTFSGLFQARRGFEAVGMPGHAGITTAVIISIAGLLFTSIFLHMVYPRYFWIIYGLALAIPNVVSNELDRSFLDSGWKQFQGELNSGRDHA